MVESPLWQQQLAADVAALLKTDPSVLSIWLVGSVGSSTAQVDEWSDADIAVVVHDNALAGWHGAVDWLRPIGRVWSTSVSQAPLRQVTRVVFDDGRRLDLVFFGHSLERPDLTGTEVWCRPPVPDLAKHAVLARPEHRRDSDKTDQLVNEFRFVATLAVVKLARDDQLVGLHLAIECARHCLVLGMLMRDSGLPAPTWDDLPAQVGRLTMPGDLASGLLAIEQSAAIFEAHLRAARHGRTLDARPLEEMIAKLRDLRGTGEVRS